MNTEDLIVELDQDDQRRLRFYRDKQTIKRSELIEYLEASDLLYQEYPGYMEISGPTEVIRLNFQNEQVSRKYELWNLMI